MATKNVIILDQADARTYRYALWADVPAARQPFYAQAGKVSVWTGASAAENTALATGAVVERVDYLQMAPGTSVAEAQAVLQATWSAFQAEITATNHWSRYGTFWNGTSWTAGGVA